MDVRRIERLLYTCPEVDYNTFPFIDEDDYMGMYSDFSQHSSEICIFIFVRELPNNVPFVDIYVWDITNLDGYDRFIICNGFRLPEGLETKFLEYINNKDVYISKTSLREINKRITDTFPQWHYRNYGTGYISVALQHMYFASHCSGPREILFKAEGLEYIAANVNRICSYNIIGTNPSAIIEEVPLKLLRVLNHEFHFSLLCDQTSLEICKEAYKQYCDYIGKGTPSVGQWNYILELYKNKGIFGGYPFKRTIYEKASNFVHQNEIDAYKQYFSLWKELRIPGKLNVPNYEGIWEALDQLLELVKYKSGKTRLNQLIAARKNSESYRYEYTNNTYEIIMPSSAFDLYCEAICQHNCLEDYVYSHAEGDTTILFLRKKTNPNKSFVTIEVGSDSIIQVYSTCNKLPQKEVYEFIVEYSKARAFDYDMGNLILENINKIDEKDVNELIEFALHNQRGAKSDPDDFLEDVIE